MTAIPPLPCMACGTVPDPVYGPNVGLRNQGNEPAQPYGATWFTTEGHYGSTAFDPQDGSQLRISVCDPCLLRHADRVWHAQYVRQPARVTFSRPWEPGPAPKHP